MKLSSSEEYGLRCLLQLARQTPGSLTIPEISQAEGITHHNVAKLLRILRQGGFVASARGQQGGYALAKPPHQIAVADALATLGGRLFDDELLRSLRRQRGLLHALAHRVFGARAVGTSAAGRGSNFIAHDPRRPAGTRLRPRRRRGPARYIGLEDNFAILNG